MATRRFTMVAHHRRAAGVVAAGFLAAGAMMLTAPVGNAIPEQQIIDECNDAKGNYTTIVIDLVRYSTCCYTGLDGFTECDHYVDGTYETTNNTLEQPPDSPPPPPPGGVVGPQATEATPAPPPGPLDSVATLFMPPPADPAAPPPSEATSSP